MFVPIWAVWIAATLITIGLYFIWFATKLAAQIRCLEYCWRDLANYGGSGLMAIIPGNNLKVIPSNYYSGLETLFSGFSDKVKNHAKMIARCGAPICNVNDDSYVWEDFILQGKRSDNDEPFFLPKGRKN